MGNFLKGLIVGSLAASVIAVALLSRPPAQGQETVGVGLYYMGMERERPKWKDLKGEEHTQTFDRFVIKVPDEYGQIIEIREGEVWCQDKDGVLRNGNLGSGLVKILPGASGVR